MTAPLTPPPPPQRSPLSPAVIVLIVIGALVVTVAIGLAAAAALWRQSVDLRYSVAAGSSVEATIPDAPLNFHASSDGRVHVVVSGWHAGPVPAFRVQTSGDTTRIEGGCSRFWFVPCSIRVDVSLPPMSELRVTGTNGEITANALDGPLRLTTTNGAVSVADTSGSLDLRSVNGAVTVQRSTSQEVTASTSNGSVRLHFLAPPQSVTGQTINGAVTVQVPSGEDYRVAAHTVNGPVDAIDSSPQASRTITVNSVNGAVTVQHTSG